MIERELIRESRNPSASWQRISYAALLMVLGLALTASPSGIPVGAGQGRVVFLQYNLLLFTLIWVLVPLLSFDTVSRERRDGTLDLLFLSPLKPLEIVVAKGFVQGLRAVIGLLATAPLLMIPIVMGGITALDVARMLCLHASATCLALFAGLAASVRYAHPIRAAAGALMLSGLFLLGLGAVYVTGSIGIFIHQSGIGWDSETVRSVAMFFYQSAWDRLPFNQPGVAFGIAPYRPGMGGGGASWGNVIQVLGVLFLSLLVIWGGLLRLAKLMQRQVLEMPMVSSVSPSEGRIWFARRWIRRWVNRVQGHQVLSFRFLMRRYHVMRRTGWISLGVGVMLFYWWFRFGGTLEAFLSKLEMLFFLLSIVLSFLQFWVIRRECETGMLDLLMTVPVGLKSYVGSMTGAAILPILPSLGGLVGCAVLLSAPVLWLEWMCFSVLYSGVFVFFFAWRRVAPSVALGVGLTVGWGAVWGIIRGIERIGLGPLGIGCCLLGCWFGLGWVAFRWGTIEARRGARLEGKG